MFAECTCKIFDCTESIYLHPKELKELTRLQATHKEQEQITAIWNSSFSSTNADLISMVWQCNSLNNS